MTRKIWTIAIAALFIICLASVADAQRRPKPTRVQPSGSGQNQNPGHQNENPGNGNQGENQGNGNQGETPEDPPNGTPDGSTPAEEATCDDLKHGTPGLYGLCIAFCEAHDCVITVTDDGELDFSQCKKNDGKILAKYRAKMRDGDPDMPCLPATQANEAPENACPCWSMEQLLNFPYAPYDAYSTVECASFQEWDFGGECDRSATIVSESAELSDGSYAYVDFAVFGGEDCKEAANYCFAAFDCPGGDCPDWMPTDDLAVENLDYEVVLNCQAQLQQLQEELFCLEP
jgi:hypothetical protein